MIVDNHIIAKEARNSGDWDDWYIAVFGETLVGLRVDQMLVSADAVSSRIDKSSIDRMETTRYIQFNLIPRMVNNKSILYI